MDHTLLMAVESTFDLEPRSLEKGMRRLGGGGVIAILLVKKSSKLAQ